MDQIDSSIKFDDGKYVQLKRTKKNLIFIVVVVELLTIVAKAATFGLISLLAVLLLAGRGAAFVVSGVYFAKSKYKTKIGYTLFIHQYHILLRTTCSIPVPRFLACCFLLA